jgi:hypothetical protein
MTATLLAGVIGAGCGACAASVVDAASHSTRESGLHCEPRVDGARGLTAAWAPFASFIDACTLVGPGRAPALSIVSVSARRYYAEQPAGVETTALPKPLVLGADGREVGQLPYGYPDDPPFAIELSFSDWREGRPQQIDILVRDPTVSGDRRLTPMRWNAATGRYAGGAER